MKKLEGGDAIDNYTFDEGGVKTLDDLTSDMAIDHQLY